MRFWIFGHNSTSVTTVSVQQYQPFLFGLTSEQTLSMINGTYRILFEFPSSGNSYGMRIASLGKQNDTVIYDPQGIRILDLDDVTDNQMNGLNAAATVEQAIRNTGIENVTGITLQVDEPEITIDPIPDQYLGDTVTIGGTTNLHPGEMLTVQIYEGYLHPCAKCQEIVNDSVLACCGSGVKREVAVMPGTCGINTWFMEVNTSGHDFREGMTYVVAVYGRNGSVWSGSSFNILLADQKPDPFYYVTINPPVASPNENTLLLSGTASTDFGPNDKFLLQITSDSGATVTAVVPVVFDGTGYSWNYTVNISALSALNSYKVNITSLNNPGIRNSSVFMV